MTRQATLRPALPVAQSAWATQACLGGATLLSVLGLGAGCSVGVPPTRVAAPPGSGSPVPAFVSWVDVAEAEGAPALAFAEAAPELVAPDTARLTASQVRFLPDPVDAELTVSRGRCPEEMALVDDRVCVDRWEASLLERRGGAERAWSPFETVDGHEHAVRAVSRPGVLPQGYINGKQAALACAASGKRLCKADEWERACRGPTRAAFPYGARRIRGACNDDVRKVHPVAEIGEKLGLEPRVLWREGMNHPLINQLPDSLEATGARAECATEEGVFDMVGNLHEWVDDPSGTFRGGYYMDTTRNGEGCSYTTRAHGVGYHDYSTGFRCCMNPSSVD